MNTVNLMIGAATPAATANGTASVSVLTRGR